MNILEKKKSNSPNSRTFVVPAPLRGCVANTCCGEDLCVDNTKLFPRLDTVIFSLSNIDSSIDLKSAQKNNYKKNVLKSIRPIRKHQHTKQIEIYNIEQKKN